MDAALARPAFSVVAGGRDKALNHPPPQRLWTCTACLSDLGVATTVSLPVTVGRMIGEGGRVFGGTETLACASCLARGKVTEVR